MFILDSETPGWSIAVRILVGHAVLGEVIASWIGTSLACVDDDLVQTTLAGGFIGFGVGIIIDAKTDRILLNNK